MCAPQSIFRHQRLRRRITETTVSGGTLVTQNNYYTTAWQLIEIAVAGTATETRVFSPTYVNAILLRDRDTDGDGRLDERLYFTHDADEDVTAAVPTTGTVEERATYAAEGEVTWRQADFAVDSGNTLAIRNTLQGGEQDLSTGNINFEMRDYNPRLYIWQTQDPIQAGMNWDIFAADNPISRMDPAGTQSFNYDVGKNQATLTESIKFTWINSPGDNWTVVREKAFQDAFKKATESAFSNSKFKAYPKLGATVVKLNDKLHPVGRSPCPGQGGIALILKISFDGAPDMAAGVYANAAGGFWRAFSQIPGKAGNRGVGANIIPNGTWSENDVTVGVSPVAPTQIQAVHEFGHLMGLDHPGQDLVPPAPPDVYPQDYLADGPALMGVGMEMRAPYFKKWVDQLNQMKPDWSPYSVH